ncbi:MAG: CAP domain-containing protein, partial [Anaerolineaceae bacterium]|nr:CAP domain-containing protein [Anaerolineaceae bacterium]
MSLRLFYSFLAFLIFTLQPQYSNVEAQETPSPPAITPFDLIDGVNRIRTANGLPPLIIDDILMGTAQYTADYMALNDLHGHIGDVKGRVMAAGYGAGANAWATENFAIGPITLDTLFNVYWADDLHMVPMYKPNYKHIGAGVTEYNGRVWYIVHAAYTGSGVYVPPP